MSNTKLKIGINGFGRIGSVVLRSIFLEKYDLDVVAINTKGDLEMESYAFQFKYDSVYGRFPSRVDFGQPQKGGEIGQLLVGESAVPFLGEPDIARIPWDQYGVDIVLECTGAFTGSIAAKHLRGSVKKAIISAPPKDTQIPVYILGVNENNYHGEKLLSNGSCTTNCVAPIVKLIDQKIGFQQGVLTTVHAYTTNQNLVDGAGKDSRRSRAAALNIVPTSTGAAESVIAAYKEAEGRFAGTAIRVPVACGSYSDLTFKLVRKTTEEEVNQIFEEASISQSLVGKLKLTYEPLVSSDIIGNNASCLIDTRQTRVISNDMLSVGAWYDNEYGYSCRLVEMALQVANYQHS